MSNDFDNTNSGALFKNDKRGNERSPEYKGECAPVCPHCGKKSEFWLSAWIKTMKKDPAKKFMSLALTPKDEPKNQSQSNFNQPPADFDDDIPFD